MSAIHSPSLSEEGPSSRWPPFHPGEPQALTGSLTGCERVRLETGSDRLGVLRTQQGRWEELGPVRDVAWAQPRVLPPAP